MEKKKGFADIGTKISFINVLSLPFSFFFIFKGGGRWGKIETKSGKESSWWSHKQIYKGT